MGWIKNIEEPFMKACRGTWFAIVRKIKRNKKEHTCLPELQIPVVTVKTKDCNIACKDKNRNDAVKNQEIFFVVTQKIKAQNHNWNKKGPVAKNGKGY